MALLKNVNIYQRVFLFSFTMAILWWLVELASFHTIEYVLNNPKVLYNTFAAFCCSNLQRGLAARIRDSSLGFFVVYNTFHCFLFSFFVFCVTCNTSAGFVSAAPPYGFFLFSSDMCGRVKNIAPRLNKNHMFAQKYEIP